MTLGRIIFSVYALVFLALSAFSSVFFYRTYNEFTNLKKQETENMRRFAEAEKNLEEQRIFLEKLQNDPAFVEREIRQRLGYARPSEVVFRFEK
ncbi:MAG: septum formation initiator family protein [Opitutaceae bacterium]|nr:septum formation initiator family protein [Opitutaceae bacterium]